MNTELRNVNSNAGYRSIGWLALRSLWAPILWLAVMALGDGSNLRIIGGADRIAVKTPGAPLRLSRDGVRPWTGTQWYAMDSNALDANPFHAAVHSNG